ncbi:COX15/CtaA family protein [Planctomonas psychrotolerans]|uniref:COX15/CtaA family protein n=1 Tax=Planctomonas psychrotolerans TaxID=2528712 RepID=UPI00123C0BFD|nr:COX15/CtaA family protein [Planctomonas psychrotolerans]
MSNSVDTGRSPSGGFLGQLALVWRRIHDRLPIDANRRVRALAWTTLAVQTLIVGTGGAVRLTGSGLGCPTWPRCTADSFVNTPEMGIHGVIEFGNRLLTFLLVIVAILTFFAVLRLRNRGYGLFSLALAIGLGIPAQAIIGGISVRTQLNPYVVGLHFVVSVVLVALSTVLVWRACNPREPRANLAPRWVRGLTLTTAVFASVTILVGIVTTGSGPHAGDSGAARNGLDSEFLQHVHSWPAYALLVLTIALYLSARRERLPRTVRYTGLLLVVLALQIVVGLAQARLGLPGILVGTHMVLACVLTSAMTAVLLSLRGSPAAEGLVVERQPEASIAD